MDEEVIRRYKLRKVRAEERAKNGSIRMPDGGDFLSGVERVGKKEKECGKRENEREAMRRELVASGEEESQWLVSCCR